MNVKDNPKIKTAILGYFDKWSPKQKFLFKKLRMKTPIEVRETMYNADEEEKYKLIIPYIKQIDNLYKKYIPDKYKKQRKKADETEFKIEGTAFTTVTTNINFQTTIHKDTGDDEDICVPVHRMVKKIPAFALALHLAGDSTVH